jgi:hypothetical protein
MAIRGQSTGRSATRLNVGADNARRYFSKNMLILSCSLSAAITKDIFQRGL